jgi:hypothetical protein
MKSRQFQEDRLAFSKYTGAVHPPKPSMATTHLLSDTKKDGSIGESTAKFQQGRARLYLAIVNRAILDVLENGKNSQAAERWLLSRDFDRLEELFG